MIFDISTFQQSLVCIRKRVAKMGSMLTSLNYDASISAVSYLAVQILQHNVSCQILDLFNNAPPDQAVSSFTATSVVESKFLLTPDHRLWKFLQPISLASMNLS
jgi:hypothetical protein